MYSVSDLKRFTFTLRQLFALVTATALVSAGIFYFLSFREASLRREGHLRCQSSLRMIGYGLEAYHNVHGCFPPPYVTDAQGKPLYSWRVLILPYMEEGHIYDQWRLDESWDSPYNRSLPIPGEWSNVNTPSYQCPVLGRNRQPGMSPYTDYLAVVGPGMAWEEGKRLSWPDFVDATSNTILLVEVRGSQIHWAEPVDFDGTGSLSINAPQGLSIGSHRDGGANILFADGAAVHLPDTTSEEEIKALFTRAGGENEGWREDGRVNDYRFGDLRWTGKSWEGNYECVDRELPFSIDFDVVDPTIEQQGRALVAARKVRCDSSDWRLSFDAPREEKTRLDAAKEVREAASGQASDTPPDKDVQQLADDMNLKSWGMTYWVDDATVFPYLIYTSPEYFPNKRIRVRFSTDLVVGKRSGEVMVIKAIDDVTVIPVNEIGR